MPELQPGQIIPLGADFSNYVLEMAGEEVAEFKEFKIDFDSEIAYKYGKNLHPVSYSQKKFKQSGKATLYLRGVRFLIEAAVAYGGDLRRLPPLTATATCDVGDYIFRMEIPGFKIKKYTLGAAEGDDDTEVPMDIEVVSHPIITMV